MQASTIIYFIIAVAHGAFMAFHNHKLDFVWFATIMMIWGAYACGLMTKKSN